MALHGLALLLAAVAGAVAPAQAADEPLCGPDLPAALQGWRSPPPFLAWGRGFRLTVPNPIDLPAPFAPPTNLSVVEPGQPPHDVDGALGLQIVADEGPAEVPLDFEWLVPRLDGAPPCRQVHRMTLRTGPGVDVRWHFRRGEGAHAAIWWTGLKYDCAQVRVAPVVLDARGRSGRRVARLADQCSPRLPRGSPGRTRTWRLHNRAERLALTAERTGPRRERVDFTLVVGDRVVDAGALLIRRSRGTPPRITRVATELTGSVRRPFPPAEGGVPVPDVSWADPALAFARLRAAGFAVSVDELPRPWCFQRGYGVDPPRPAPGTAVAPGATVRLTVGPGLLGSGGPRLPAPGTLVQVPDLRHLRLSEAVDRLYRLGLGWAFTATPLRASKAASLFAAYEVVAQHPAAAPHVVGRGPGAFAGTVRLAVAPRGHLAPPPRGWRLGFC